MCQDETVTIHGLGGKKTVVLKNEFDKPYRKAGKMNSWQRVTTEIICNTVSKLRQQYVSLKWIQRAGYILRLRMG